MNLVLKIFLKKKKKNKVSKSTLYFVFGEAFYVSLFLFKKKKKLVSVSFDNYFFILRWKCVIKKLPNIALDFCSFHPCVMVYSLKISPAQMYFKTMLITWPEGVKRRSHSPFSLYTRHFLRGQQITIR